MTAAELRATLAGALSDVLGTYRTPFGTRPAIYVGEPPNDWTASGLEVRISIVPDIEQISTYQQGVLNETHQVRLVNRGAPSDTLTALRRILRRWPDAQATEVPPNERLGILQQHTITIPA